MSRFKLAAVLLLGAVILPGSLSAAPGSNSLHWQEGQILSRKTIAPGHHNTQTRYIYYIKGGGMQYTVRCDQPLSLALYAPLKFSVSRKHLLVQDADGSELKASILKKSEPAIRR